jgi:hypothetical protein
MPSIARATLNAPAGVDAIDDSLVEAEAAIAATASVAPPPRGTERCRPVVVVVVVVVVARLRC